jgi:hypothetical protein
MRSSLALTAFMKPVFPSVASVRKTWLRQPPDPHRDALTLRFGFGEADARLLRIGEHEIEDLTIVGLAIAASHIVRDDPGCLPDEEGELRSSGNPEWLSEESHSLPVGARARLQGTHAGRCPRISLSR